MKKLQKNFLIFCVSLGAMIGAVVAYLNRLKTP